MQLRPSASWTSLLHPPQRTPSMWAGCFTGSLHRRNGGNGQTLWSECLLG